RIAGLFADSSFTEVEVTWAVYQDIVNAYRTADRNEGKKLLRTVIDALTTNLPTELVELKRVGRTLNRRAADGPAFFTRPGPSAGSSFPQVEVTWAVYQDIVNAYRTADRNEGKKLLRTVIDALTTNLPTELVELKRLGRTLKRRAADVLAFFTRPGTSNGPTE